MSNLSELAVPAEVKEVKKAQPDTREVVVLSRGQRRNVGDRLGFHGEDAKAQQLAELEQTGTNGLTDQE
jgi:hypothetical protein